MSVLRKAVCVFALIMLSAVVGRTQARAMYLGNVELRLGMSQVETLRRLSNEYNVSMLGGGVGPGMFIVRRYDRKAKDYDDLGVIGFEGDVLTYITKWIDTSAWPDDEGFGTGRAIYDAVDASIPFTDRDAAKRATASVVILSQDVEKPTRGNLKTVSIFMSGGQRIIVSIWDGTDGRHVSASMAIQSKPW